METLSRGVLTFLLNAAWQVVLVTAVATLSAGLLRRAPARYRHALWVLALTLAVLLPLTSWFDTSQVAVAPRVATVQTLPRESPPLPAKPSLAPPPEAAPVANVSSSSHVAPPDAARASGKIYWLLLNPLRRHSRAIALPPVVAYAALGLFFLSLLCHLTRLVRAWRRTSQFRHSASLRALPKNLAALVAECRAALGLEDVALRVSSEVAGPATVGFFNPVIILPEVLFQAASSEELTSVLCHEMAHIRRRDYLLNLLCEFAFLPIAFHPAAWLLKRRIDETRELACDEIATAGLVSAAAYARSLVSLAHSMSSLASLSRPRYTLGVFDANILEERVKRLLDTKPRAGARRAKLVFGGAAAALALAAVTACAFSFTATANTKVAGSGGATVDFSGRWELDRTKSQLPSPAPENLVESIEQRGSLLKVNATSKDWNIDKPIAVTLFALMMPELSTTLDNRETIQQFGPGEMRSKTRWEDSRLVTDWTLERGGQVMVTGQWVRSLSDNHKTQTVDIAARDPQGTEGHAKAVFVKKGNDAAQAFVGTWRGEFEGKTFIRVILKKAENTLAGTISIGGFGIDSTGQVVRVNVEADPQHALPILDVKLDSSLLTFGFRSGLPVTDYRVQMRLIGDKQAELKSLVPTPPPGTPIPGWWKLSRESDDPRAGDTQSGVVGGVVGGVPGGVTGGTVGGVTGGTVGGVPGGVVGGVVRGVSASPRARAEEQSGTISGTVSDPSGARVPDAVVSLNADSGIYKTDVTNEVGEFSFTGLPAGHYRLRVNDPGFALFERSLGVMPDGSVEFNGKSYALGPGVAPSRIKITLGVGPLTQIVVITAKAPQHVVDKRHVVTPQRIRVGGQVEAAKLVSQTRPDYPESAREKGIEGEVVLEAVISMEGVPLSLHVLKSPDPDLSEAAMTAVQEWRYQPTLLNGQPIEVDTTIAVRFQLEN